jgi:hypothetical protein
MLQVCLKVIQKAAQPNWHVKLIIRTANLIAAGSLAATLIVVIRSIFVAKKTTKEMIKQLMLWSRSLLTTEASDRYMLAILGPI